jgi:transmembrane sensor
MDTVKLYDLLAKKHAGEITEAELAELNKMTAENWEAALILSATEKTWRLKTDTAPLNPAYKEERWASLQKRISAKSETAQQDEVVFVVPLYRKTKWIVSIAAAATILIFSSIYFFNSKSTAPSAKQNIVSTKNGSRSKIEMPDGTQVWLNADSRLTYDNSTFGKNIREVTLSGEAYFDVVKDKEHPFIIHTKAMDIKVLGTAFNVKAYPNDRKSEAALIHGSIEVSFTNRPAQKLILKPNEKIIVENSVADDSKYSAKEPIAEQSPSVSVSKVTFLPADSTVIESAWTKNRLVFKGKLFEDLAADMERWYNIRVIFKDSSLMQRRLTGTFQDENIEDVLEYLKLTVGFKYEYNRLEKAVYINN